MRPVALEEHWYPGIEKTTLSPQLLQLLKLRKVVTLSKFVTSGRMAVTQRTPAWAAGYSW